MNPGAHGPPARNCTAPNTEWIPAFGNAASTCAHVHGLFCGHTVLPGAPDAHHTPFSGDHVCHVPGVTVPDMYGSNVSRPCQAVLLSVRS